MARPSLVRWLGIGLRAGHLASVIFLGAGLLAGHTTDIAVAAVLGSGLALFVLDTWNYPRHLLEISGASVLIKLALVAAMAADAAWRLPLFWIVIVWSVLFSHAPASLRHRRLR